MTLLSFFGPFSGSEIVRGTPNTLIKLLINMFVLKTADYVNKKTNKQPEMLPCVIQFNILLLPFSFSLQPNLTWTTQNPRLGFILARMQNLLELRVNQIKDVYILTLKN